MWHCQACKLNLGVQLTEEHSTGVTLKTHRVIHPKTNNKVKYFATKLKKRGGCKIRLRFGLRKGMKNSTIGRAHKCKNNNNNKKTMLSVYVIISGSS